MQREEFQKQHGIIGESVAITEIVEIIRQVAPTDITVLITAKVESEKKSLPKQFIKPANEPASR